MLQEINWSLVSWCNADCVFCPRSDYEAKQRFMKMDLIEKLVDEIKSEEFKAKHDIALMSVGENGESTLHSHFIDILRLLNTTGIPIHLYTNFSVLDENLFMPIIEENLLREIHTNIDGSSPLKYYAMKRLDSFPVMRNLFAFFEARKESPIKINIHSIPVINYMNAVKKHFGVDDSYFPKNFGKMASLGEEPDIKRHWYPLLREDETIAFDDILMWGERNRLPYREGNYSCTQLGRVKHSLFVAPNGDYYVCCFDVENRLTIGDLYKSSIDDLYMNDRHQEIIGALERRDFDSIGAPCNRVDCCQVVCPHGK